MKINIKTGLKDWLNDMENFLTKSTSKSSLKTLNIYSFDFSKLRIFNCPLRKLPTQTNTNSVSTECHICFCEINLKNNDSIILSNCQHEFHKECVRLHVLADQDSMRHDAICPEELCGSIFSIANIKKVLTPEEFGKYQSTAFRKKAILQPDKYIFCQTPDCDFILEKDTSVRLERCELCLINYCTLCDKPEHASDSCLEAREEICQDASWLELIESQKWKRCNGCKFYIERSEGCRHMTCKCGHQFCYVCCAVWQTCNCEDPQQEAARLRYEQQERELQERQEQALGGVQNLFEDAQLQLEEEEEDIYEGGLFG